MKHDPSNTQNLPVQNPAEPNDDGCVIGTAGRDEDPNATTDWNHQGSHATPADATVKPANGTPGIDTVPDSENAGAD